ncbi:unnamed protein product [Cylicocyclus nassatus]|uniref:Abnormal cell migration protein 18-like fibronectin type I domain-containing protein n=1 Tax=Cylicocyclus nassatus TaxID=53992 RepID=A0AA36H6T0_CYLNA|nr:unnamed protein product [Cylicocyclus nassatus]
MPNMTIKRRHRRFFGSSLGLLKMRALIIAFVLIAIAYSLCIVNGKRHKENEIWKDDEDWTIKQCKKGKRGWKPEVVECIFGNNFKFFIGRKRSGSAGF